MIATMRKTCCRTERLRVLALDVTTPQRIVSAIEAPGPRDVLVNNAGPRAFLRSSAGQPGPRPAIETPSEDL